MTLRPVAAQTEPGAARIRKEYERISKDSGGDPAMCLRRHRVWRTFSGVS